ncbi:MAG: hypothetical protein AAFO03_13310 [Bacteroidota bacterium]
MRASFLIIVLVVAALCWNACGEKEAVNLRLTPMERNRIDTLYTVRLDSLRPIWDSLCEVNHSLVVAAAVDSIVQQRLEEEARLRSRFTEE